ncbi:MAG: internal scaffolding protein [Microvirus sp.]|nr:MAG: internal scaffolding protein [Microvirus sp.]
MLKPPFIRSANNYDAFEASNETGLKCEDISLAQQHQKEEADINTIIRRFGISGQLPTNVRMPTYGDFTDVTNYHEALTAVKEAENSFMAMPAYIRERFGNNPEKFVEFCSDDANYDEAIKLGLVPSKPTSDPVQTAPQAVQGTESTPKA